MVSGHDCAGDDCDDSRDDVHPGATEVCDDVDQNCDGSVLDVAGADDDGDTALDEECGGVDCDDEDAEINEEAPEVFNGALLKFLDRIKW